MPAISDRERLLARVRHILSSYVEPARFGPSVPFELAAHHIAGEPVGYQEALDGPWSAFAPGQRWGGAWATTWFRARAAVPEAWAGERVDARFDLGYHGSPGFGVLMQSTRVPSSPSHQYAGHSSPPATTPRLPRVW